MHKLRLYESTSQTYRHRRKKESDWMEITKNWSSSWVLRSVRGWVEHIHTRSVRSVRPFLASLQLTPLQLVHWLFGFKFTWMTERENSLCFLSEHTQENESGSWGRGQMEGEEAHWKGFPWILINGNWWVTVSMLLLFRNTSYCVQCTVWLEHTAPVCVFVQVNNSRDEKFGLVWGGGVAIRWDQHRQTKLEEKSVWPKGLNLL